MIDASGAIVGEAVLELVEIQGALDRDDGHLLISTTESDSPLGRCVRFLTSETASLSTGNAVVSFLRDGLDLYLLTIRRIGDSDGMSNRVRVSIVEPLAVSRARRVVAAADLSRTEHAGAYEEYAVDVPIRPPEDSHAVPSYVGLVLLDKVLSRFGRRDSESREVDWAG